LPVIRHTTNPQDWPKLLNHAGLRQTSSKEIQMPGENTPGCLIVTATPSAALATESDNVNLDNLLA
jgi:hypothetical protein